MSWQAWVMLVLAATLIGGFVWYERSRPPTQIVALIAALSAISVAGRIALSPIPNVVPTTDIVLIAGYALGGPPGFAVGALSGLVSNFWLGQGPWTPWQMAGWGMAGLFGAWLSMATRRRVGRVGLAAACAVAGIAYGALLDFSLMVTYGGEQSLDRFLILSGRGLPFNVAHAAGNAALALVAGPAIVRMLTRYRRRFEFAWRPPRAPARRRRPAAGAACVLAALLLAAPALVPGGRADAADPVLTNRVAPTDTLASTGAGRTVAWLRAAQNEDGGFGYGRGEDSNPGMTGWAVLGLEAAGINPLDLARGDATPISYLAGTVDEITTTGDIERTILVLRGAGLDPRRFGGDDLIRRLRARRGGDGSWGGQVNSTAFGILALGAAGASAGNTRSAGWLRSIQNDDGGWGFAAGAQSDPDTTGAVLQALAVSVDARVRVGATRLMSGIRAGVRYLRGAERPGGGFALSGGPVNAQSTSWAIQGLIAAGVAPSSVWRGGRSPLDYLSSVRAGDGHYRYSASTDQTPVWVTGQALIAINRRAFPLAPVPRASAPAASGGKSDTGDAPSGAGTHGARSAKSKPSGSPAPSAHPAPVPPEPVSLAPASSSDREDDGGGMPAWLIAAGLAAAVPGAVWGGWLVYRRRLP
ncbi:MAG TPA: prenyltransferase/squalene oxidase repeat-containing protein [Solirubrobacterales bacterium]